MQSSCPIVPSEQTYVKATYILFLGHPLEPWFIDLELWKVSDSDSMYCHTHFLQWIIS